MLIIIPSDNKHCLKLLNTRYSDFDKKVYNTFMKIWITDTQTPTHRLVRFNCEEHSDYKYIGDLTDDELRSFFLEIQEDMDVEKNINLIKYYGYLHLFVIHKS